MKKFIMLSAVMAAVSTAFIACSSDDDLAQAPAVPEESVSKGIPFSVVAFNTDDTRAVRYNADGEGVNPDGTAATGDDAFVKSFKLYGVQKENDNNVWIDNLIFARTAADGKFLPARDKNNNAYTSTLTWPTEKTDKATTFYAITDNAIPTTENNSNLAKVDWTPASGSFTYTMPTKSGTVSYYDFNEYDYASKSMTIADVSAMRDLMVATATKTAAANPANTVNLSFDHVLSGLAINAWYVSGNAEVPDNIDIRAIFVCGLKSVSTYTFGSGFAAPTADVVYYKQFVDNVNTDTGIQLSKQTMANWSDPHMVNLVAPGEWLVIPQTCTPWNRNRDDSDVFPSMDGAFICLLVDDGQDANLLTFPLTTNAAHKADLSNTTLSSLSNVTFNPGKTRTININVALGRGHYTGTETVAPFIWTPSEVNAQ